MRSLVELCIQSLPQLSTFISCRMETTQLRGPWNMRLEPGKSPVTLVLELCGKVSQGFTANSQERLKPS